jgi:signal transduction histidine kinase/DNA-binding response OmpR family regulator
MNIEKTYRILIVEEDEKFLHYFGEVLNANFPVAIDSSVSARKAILLIDYHTYDLICINIEMSGMREVELPDYINKSFLNSKTPMVFLSSADPAKRTAPTYSFEGILDVIHKPIIESELIHSVQLYFHFIKKENEHKHLLQYEIKKREQAEAELKRSRENFNNIVDKSTSGILIVGEDGIIQFINDIGEQIFLRKKEELIGQSFGMIAGYQTKTEIDIVRRNGEVGIGEITLADTEWKGKPAKLVFINDITKHKKMQENLEEARLKAMESDNLKTAFLANMSHEIRTPLNGIMGFSQLLDKNNLDPIKKHLYLHSIISCGNYLLDIINDIIDIAQIESGQITIAPYAFDLMELMKEIEELYSINNKVLANNLELICDVPAVQSMIIRTDPSRLRQILINLLNNAVKFTDNGKISFGFEVQNEDTLRFYVSDTGIGIPKNEFENIFERFRKVDRIKNKLYEGTGLGLSISKALVQLLGGVIWLESEPEVGTSFYFSIKAQKVDKSALSTQMAFTSDSNQSFHNKKILIVEDEETNFYFIESAIKNYETIIYWAKDGEEAVEIARRENIDLILMDMKLPVKSGYEAVKEIRLLNPNVPIIAQTAYAMGGDRDKVIAAGCNDYISKPIKVNELVFKMNAYLN